MQNFRVEILVTVNTLEKVSEAEVQDAIKGCLEEFDGLYNWKRSSKLSTTAEIQDCNKIS